MILTGKTEIVGENPVSVPLLTHTHTFHVANTENSATVIRYTFTVSITKSFIL
jgi:hypothetical protein